MHSGLKPIAWNSARRLTLAQAGILIAVSKGTPAIKVNEPQRKPLNNLLRKGYVKLIGSGETYTLGITLKGHTRLEKASAILKAWDDLQTLMME